MDFSIVTPSFNQSPWLKLCVASVADQPGVELEHLVQDSCSTDSTRDWLTKDSRVKAVIEKDSGMYDAVNRGFRRASGEFFAYLNCDEQYLSGALQDVRGFFYKHPHTDVVLTDAIVADTDGNYICHRCSLTPIEPLIWISFPVLTCALFIRRSAIERTGIYFDTQWKNLGDWFWMHELVKRGVRMDVLPRFTSVFTDTGENFSLDSSGMAERRLKWQMSPRWVRWLKYPIIAHNRLRLAGRGAFFQPPFDYAPYTQANPNQRVTRRAAKPTSFWKGRRKLVLLPP